jgi:hypothetical protein
MSSILLSFQLISSVQAVLLFRMARLALNIRIITAVEKEDGRRK